MGIFDDFRAGKKLESDENVISLTTMDETGSNFDTIKRQAAGHVVEWVEKHHKILANEVKSIGHNVEEKINSPVDNSEVVKKASFKFIARHPMLKKASFTLAVDYDVDSFNKYAIKEITKKSAAKKVNKVRQIVAYDMKENKYKVYGDYTLKIEETLRNAGIMGDNLFSKDLDNDVYEVFPFGKKENQIVAQMFDSVQEPEDVEAQTTFKISSTVLNTELGIRKVSDGDNWSVSIINGGSNMIKQLVENKQLTYFELKKALIDMGLVDASNVLDDNVTTFLTQQEQAIVQEQQDNMQQIAPTQSDGDIENFPGTATASKKDASEEIVEETQTPQETPKENEVVDKTQEIPETPKENKVVDETQTPQETPKTNDLIEENQNPSETPKENEIVNETQEPSEIPSEAGDVIKENVFQEQMIIKGKLKSKIMTDWNTGVINDKEAVKRLAAAEKEFKLVSDDPTAKKDDVKGVVSKAEVNVPKEMDNSEIIVEKDSDAPKTPKSNDVVDEATSPSKTPNNTDVITDGDSGKLPKDTVEKKSAIRTVANKRFEAHKRISRKRLSINTAGVSVDVIKLLEARNEAIYENNVVLLKHFDKQILKQLQIQEAQGTIVEEKKIEIEQGINEGSVL